MTDFRVGNSRRQRRLSPTSFQGCPQVVAHRLLGKLLVRKLDGHRLSGLIVEVEAYLSANDPASHSAVGVRPRHASMFLAAGALYVYAIHSRHCLNIVTERPGLGSAILIRAIEPLEGIDIMTVNRQGAGNSNHGCQVGHLRHLASGPGRLCQALKVDRSLDGIDLLSSDQLWIEQPPSRVRRSSWKMGVSSRIGISRGHDLLLRWFIDGHQLVSGRASDHRAGRSWRFGALGLVSDTDC